MGFFDILTNMDSEVTQKANNESLGSGFKRFGLLLLLIGILLGIVAMLAVNSLGPLGALIPGGGVTALVIVAIIVIILGLILWLVSGGLLYGAAKLVGGQGTFGKQMGASTLILWPNVVIALIAIIIFAILSLAGPVISSLAMLIILYPLLFFLSYLTNYFMILYLKEVHRLSTFKAAVAAALSVLFLLILLFIILAILGVSLASLGGVGTPPQY